MKRALPAILPVAGIFLYAGCSSHPLDHWHKHHSGRAFAVHDHDYGPPNTARILPGDREREREFNGDRYLISPKQPWGWPGCFGYSP